MSPTAPYTPQDFGYPLMLEDYISVSSPITDVADLCAACHTPDAKNKCSRCKNIRYCSPACQKRSWDTHHKLVCKAYANVTREYISRALRRVLYFPEKVHKPLFSILAFDEEGTVGDLEHYFPGVPAQEIKKLSFHDRYLPYFVQINYDTNPHGERALTENKSFGRPFRGPIVVLAYDLETALSGPALNADTTMMGPLMDYVKLCREYDGPKFIEQPQQKYTKSELEDIMGKAAISGLRKGTN
ncbi:hypothetical protein G6011_07299 [Alternaria panax]|uniref:MYND-type domain-containing protein n=1 Tax=Alternaria panax TaxID=48097 RepID=A0AAD4I9F0_9PLEO|nr:hypothetical protein G6011_07299 [Alternaria panax]